MVDAAMLELHRLREGLEGDDPALVRAMFSELMGYVQLYFDTAQKGGRNRHRLARFVVQFRHPMICQLTETPR